MQLPQLEGLMSDLDPKPAVFSKLHTYKPNFTYKQFGMLAVLSKISPFLFCQNYFAVKDRDKEMNLN